MRTVKRNTISACPFIDCGDKRCGKRLNLGSIDQAFGVCLGNYQSCPIYKLLMIQKSRLSAMPQQRAVA